ncbi:hypothetical protein GNF07_25825, partial [Trichormus variabilis FSR]
VKAHSIQNNKILNKISLNGNVYCFSLSEDDEHHLQVVLAKKGRKVATIFTGFCSYHDNAIFKPIEEQDFQKNNYQQEFLFAYRALAKEYHAKKELIKRLEKVKEISDLKEKWQIQQLDALLIGSQITLNKLEDNKQIFNSVLKQRNFDIIGTRIIKLHGECQIAVSSVFAIVNDLNGKNIHNTIEFVDLNKELKLLYVTIFPQGGKTYILFSYLRRHRKYLAPVIRQIANRSIAEQKKIISNMIAVYVENLALSPNAWGKMSDSEKSIFYELNMENVFSTGK